MANKGRATFAKRQKEIARQERAREKAAKRVERKETKTRVDRHATEVDPDIAGIGAARGSPPVEYTSRVALSSLVSLRLRMRRF